MIVVTDDFNVLLRKGPQLNQKNTREWICLIKDWLEKIEKGEKRIDEFRSYLLRIEVDEKEIPSFPEGVVKK